VRSLKNYHANCQQFYQEDKR